MAPRMVYSLQIDPRPSTITERRACTKQATRSRNLARSAARQRLAGVTRVKPEQSGALRDTPPTSRQYLRSQMQQFAKRVLIFNATGRILFTAPESKARKLMETGEFTKRNKGKIVREMLLHEHAGGDPNPTHKPTTASDYGTRYTFKQHVGGTRTRPAIVHTLASLAPHLAASERKAGRDGDKVFTSADSRIHFMSVTDSIAVTGYALGWPKHSSLASRQRVTPNCAPQPAGKWDA